MSVEVGTVFGAAKREQRVTEAPSSVTIVTAEDIRTFGWRTLAEALNSVRGFYITNDRNYAYVGVRGFGRPSDYNNRVLLLVNGHRYNDNVYDQALIGTRVPDRPGARRSHRGHPRPGLGALRHERLLRGDQRRRCARAARRRQRVVDRGRQLRHVRGFAPATGARSASGVDSLLSISHITTQRPEPALLPASTTSRRPTSASTATPTASRRPACSGSVGRGRFTLQGAFGSRRKVRPDRLLRDDAGRPQRHRSTRAAGSTRMVTGAFRGAALSGRVFADYSRLPWRLRLPRRRLDSRDTARWRLGRGRGDGVAPPRLPAPGDDRASSIGATCVQDQASYAVDPFESNLDCPLPVATRSPSTRRTRLCCTARLTATVGGRYDWWSLTGGTATPRVGLVYRTDADTAIKALYGEAYRAPDGLRDLLLPRSVRAHAAAGAAADLRDRLRAVPRRHAAPHRDRLRHPRPQPDLPGRRLRASRTASRRDRAVSSSRRSAGGRTGVLLRGSYVAQRTRGPDRRRRALELAAPARAGRMRAAPMWTPELSLAAESQYVGRRFSTLGTPIDGVWLTNINVIRAAAAAPISVAARVSNLFDRPTRIRSASSSARTRCRRTAARLGPRHAAVLNGLLPGVSRIEPLVRRCCGDALLSLGGACPRETDARSRAARSSAGTAHALVRHVWPSRSNRPSRDVRGSRPTVGGPADPRPATGDVLAEKAAADRRSRRGVPVQPQQGQRIRSGAATSAAARGVGEAAGSDCRREHVSPRATAPRRSAAAAPIIGEQQDHRGRSTASASTRPTAR